MFHELVWAVPFAALLASIAVLPLVHKHFWERNYPWIALGLGSVTVLRYLLAGETAPLLHSAAEYVSFICLIGSLYVVAGGIHIRVKGEATPSFNCLFLFIGAVLSNFLGTTGASMVLIRPWLRMNKYRLTSFHVVFFIFIVSNVGGVLTPIGDPPLFLGYLRGVPFFWVFENIWPAWVVAVGSLLGIFYVLDRKNFLRAPREVRRAETAHEEWIFEGLRNLVFLAVILLAVFVSRPFLLREALMLAAAAGSYWATPGRVHEKNAFNFEPIREVAILFLGIFATMIPALHWLEHNAASIGIRTAGQFYWGSGVLSAVLDNAPTYLNFLSASIGLFVDAESVAQIQRIAAAHGGNLAAAAGAHAGELRNTLLFLDRFHAPRLAAGHLSLESVRVSHLLANRSEYVRAISCGAVFFGAATYIGNGPNFLVKSIAEQSKARTPSFFGYVASYTLPYLLPVLAAVGWLFFRG